MSRSPAIGGQASGLRPELGWKLDELQAKIFSPKDEDKRGVGSEITQDKNGKIRSTAGRGRWNENVQGREGGDRR